MFPGVGVRVSRYAYLVSLFPASLARELGVDVELRRRRVASYTPAGDTGLLVDGDDAVTRESMTRATGDPGAFAAWERFYAAIAGVAPRLFATMTEPLRPRAEIRRLVDDEAVWRCCSRSRCRRHSSPRSRPISCAAWCSQTRRSARSRRPTTRCCARTAAFCTT